MTPVSAKNSWRERGSSRSVEVMVAEMGMLRQLADTADTCPVAVLHADRSPSSHAHRAELTELVERLPFAVMHRWYEDLGTRRPGHGPREGRADLGEITVAGNTRAYLCGPLPFMLGMRAALLEKGVMAEDIHYKVFGPDSGAVAGDSLRPDPFDANGLQATVIARFYYDNRVRDGDKFYVRADPSM